MERKDAIIYAIHNEIKSENSYNTLAKVFEDRESKEVFSHLSKIEAIHKDKLIKLFKKEFPEAALDIDRNATFKIPRQEGLKDPVVALQYAIGKEQSAGEGYQKLAELSKDAETTKLFLMLAADEKNHEDLLETEIARLTGSMMWFDVSELGGLME